MTSVFNTLATERNPKVAPAASSKKAIFLRRATLLFAAMALLTGAGMGLSASPASAMSVASMVRTGATPSVDTNYVTLIFTNNTSHSYPCDGGSTFTTDFPNHVKTADNGCGVRVWLHTHSNNTGYSGCMNPNTDYSVGTTYTFVNVYISTNASDCNYSEAGKN